MCWNVFLVHRKVVGKKRKLWPSGSRGTLKDIYQERLEVDVTEVDLEEELARMNVVLETW